MSTTADLPQSETLPLQQQALSRNDLVAEFQTNQTRLMRLIELRLDRRLAGRIDPSDVFQETFLRANAAFDEYCRLSSIPIFNWLRIQAQFAVGDCHRTLWERSSERWGWNTVPRVRRWRMHLRNWRNP